MSYLAEVVMWLLAGAAGGLALGEGIGQLRRRAAATKDDRR